MDRLCKDCKWARPFGLLDRISRSWTFAHCDHPQAPREKDLVTGQVHLGFCMTERLDGRSCGLRGLRWESKEKK